MTPLPRWVLLAMLLALVAAHPTDYACVRLCRARDTSPEITGVCEHQQKLVLQSSGGRFPIQRLFGLCLTPCHGTATSNSPLLDGSRTCRTFRDYLIRRLGCFCDILNYEIVENFEEDQRRIKEFEENQLRETDGLQTLRKIDEEEAVKPTELEVQQDQRNRKTMKITGLEEDNLDKAESEDSADLNTGSPMESEETSVDWDLWCMTQCDNGQGGSACHCDLIP